MPAMSGGADGSIVIETALDPEGFEKGVDAVNSKLQSMSNGIRDLGAKLAKSVSSSLSNIASNLRSIEHSAETGFSNGKAVLSFSNKLENLEEQLETARRQLAEFGATQIPTEEYTQLTTQLSKAEQALARLEDRKALLEEMGVDENSAQWTRLNAQIAEAEAKVRAFEEDLSVLQGQGGAFVQGTDTEEYARMQAEVAELGNALNRNKSLINQEAIEQARLNVLTAQEAVAAATSTREREKAIQRLREAQQALSDLAQSTAQQGDMGEVQSRWNEMVTLSGTLKNAFSSAFESIRNGAQMAGTAITHPIQSMDRFLGAIGSKAVSAVGQFGSAMKSAASKAMSLTATLAKMSFKGVANGFKRISSSVKNYITNAKSAKLQSNFLVKSLTSLKRMLVTRVKRMFISQIFNGVKEAMQTLALFSDDFNTSMSNIKNSAKQLSGNIAVTFGNLIQTVEPIITSFINTLSKAVSYINAFFSMLSGKSTMTVAKKQTDSYRDSLSDAADSAKDLKNQVYGFDELNKRNDDSDSKKSGAGDGSDLFEEVAVDSVLPDKLKSYFEELKELWDNGEYFNFGNKLAEGLNAALQVGDDWINNTLRPTGVKWAGNIAAILNGLVDGVNWALLGKTLADGLNAVFDILNTFLTEFDFKALGDGIGQAINSLFYFIDWGLLGQTVANGLNSIVDIIYGIVNRINWAMLGNRIAEFVQSFFDAVNWDTISATISTAINGIVTAFQHLLDGVDWIGITTNLMTCLNDMVANVDWTAIGALIGTAFQTALSVFFTAIGTFNWGGVITGLFNAVSGFINGVDWAQLAVTMSTNVANALKSISKGIQDVDWKQLATDLWTAIKNFFTNVDWAGLASSLAELIGSTYGAAAAAVLTLIGDIFSDLWTAIKENFTENGEFTWEGFKEGLINGVTGIATWIIDNIFLPFWNGIKAAFGINSPATTMMEIGGYVIEGLLQGIRNAWGSITSFFSTAVSNIKSTLTNGWNAVKTAATSAWTSIKSNITNKFNSAKQSVTTTMNGLKTTLSNGWSSIKSTASSKWNSLKTTLSNVKWNSIGTNLVSGLRSGITNAWSSLTTTVTNLGRSLTNGLKNIFGVHSPSTVWAAIGEFLDMGLVKGVDGEKRTVLSTVANLASDVNDELNDNHATMQIDADGSTMLDKLGGIATQLGNIVAEFRAITSMLDRIGGLSVPDIASGTEVPYKTRVSSDSDNPVWELSSDLDERMVQQTDILKKLLELLERSKLGVDSDDLASAIAFAMRGAQRGFGGA